MELELNREHINCYELVLDTTLCQEETLESIVPDAYPDILRIVDTTGQVCLSGKMIREGNITVSGTVQSWIFYQPEGEERLCRMEVKLPFTVQAEAAGLHSQGQAVAVPFLRGMDARALNPRKILLRADLGMELQVFQPQELVLCQGITGGEEAGVQQLTTDQTAYLTVCVAEKSFTIADEVRLSAGPGGEGELLGVRAQALCGESKIIGNKLIFKGEAELQILYRAGEELCSMRCPLPFSQIMEVSNVGEGGDCTVELSVTELECSLCGDDRRTLDVTLELLGQSVVREEHPITLLQDIYSTSCELTCEQETYTFRQLLEQAVRPQNVRELVETGALVKTVVDASLAVAEVRQSREEDQLVLSADLRLNVLYLDELDALQTSQRLFSVTGRVDVPAGGTCLLRCTCPGEIFATPAAGGLEVRFTLEFRCLTTLERKVAGISGVKLGQARTQQEGEQPSVVLRLAAPGERLWDIAKAYYTTAEQIIQANQLEDGQVPAGQMLLIPRVR